MLRLRLFDVLERFTSNVVGPFYRRLGKNLAETGVRIQGDPNADDRRETLCINTLIQSSPVVPSTRCRPVRNVIPQLGRVSFFLS